MAQHFQLPISFEFTHQRQSWQACSFSVFEKDKTLTGRTPPLVEPLLKPSEFQIQLHGCEAHIVSSAPKRLRFDTYSAELGTIFEALHRLLLAGRDIPEELSELLVCFDQSPRPSRRGDPWRMREEFLSLNETNSALLAFLRKWGSLGLDQSVYSLVPQTDRILGLSGRKSYECVLPFFAWQRRKELRYGILQQPEAWLSQHAAIGFTRQRSTFPYIGIEAKSCFRAIELTITLDHLRDVKSRVCARPDCDSIFTVDSKHGKVYCTQYCAHLVSVRRGRAAKKKASTIARRKES